MQWKMGGRDRYTDGSGAAEVMRLFSKSSAPSASNRGPILLSLFTRSHTHTHTHTHWHTDTPTHSETEHNFQPIALFFFFFFFFFFYSFAFSLGFYFSSLPSVQSSGSSQWHRFTSLGCVFSSISPYEPVAGSSSCLIYLLLFIITFLVVDTPSLVVVASCLVSRAVGSISSSDADSVSIWLTSW